MSPHITTALVALKTVTLVFGGLITYFAFKAYRRTNARPLQQLALGFAFVTLGSLVAGGAHQAFGLPLEVVLVIEAALTAVGFGVIVYSLYVE